MRLGSVIFVDDSDLWAETVNKPWALLALLTLRLHPPPASIFLHLADPGSLTTHTGASASGIFSSRRLALLRSSALHDRSLWISLFHTLKRIDLNLYQRKLRSSTILSFAFAMLLLVGQVLSSWFCAGAPEWKI
ncbi:hypothetical protein BDV98DRAFT_52649 [Pterulicium gracile]|uniref:Uncharacterized protein n=1 Tax=Pterulicium gracile TaxID=1884261 RepID=A0A5C3QJR2_9AGAR|nr:hypothetical protein BDV98DRAFT_52649 [Pterula gracilis]